MDPEVKEYRSIYWIKRYPETLFMRIKIDLSDYINGY